MSVLKPCLVAFSCVAASALTFAGGVVNTSGPSDPLAMGETQFERELEKRFQYGPPQPEPPELADRKNGQEADATYFSQFPEFDRAYTEIQRREARRLAAKLEADAGTLTHEEFVLRAAEIAALADNGHTAIGENAFKKNTPRLPLRTYLFADGLRVIQAPASQVWLLGARIEKIDGNPIAKVFESIRRFRGGTENYRRLSLTPMLESPALLMAAGVANARDALTLQGTRFDGSAFEVRMSAEIRDRSAWVSSTARLLYGYPANQVRNGLLAFQTRGPLPVYLQHPTELFTALVLPGEGFYIGLTHNADGDDVKIGPFLTQALASIRATRPKFVVVDVRMNGGGDYTTTYDFARALPKVMPVDARLYVLTSGWTFSAAITTAAVLKEAGGTRAQIVGEPVGDRLAFWAEGGQFKLPNAFVSISYAAGYHDYMKPCTDWSKCFWLNYRYPVRVKHLDPDISAPLTFAAYAAGRDPALEAIGDREAKFTSRR